MKLKFFLAIIFFLSSFSFAQTYEPIHKFDPTRDPGKDLKAAIKEAKKTNKRIILDIGGDWCIWCKRMDAFIEENTDLKEFLNDNYILMKVNFSKENKNEKFLSKFPKIEGYPHLFVLDKNGKLLHSQNTGELEKDKSYSKEKWMEFLSKWAIKKK